MKLKLLKVAPYSLLCFFLSFSSTGLAQGDLMIMPKRLVFDGSQRSHEISLANTGSDSTTYAISFVQYNMLEDGSFQEVTEPVEGQRFAANFLRYYPRRVVLGPNEAQTVRVQVTRTGNLEEGEYRSHIYFRAVEEQVALGQEDVSGEEESISIQINTVFGISIPVIIRHGNSTTEMSLSDISLDHETNTLSLTLNRSGNMSVYGNIEVVHIASDGKETEVGLVKGLSVYTPNHIRKFTFQLQHTEGLNLGEGKLRVTYKEELGKTLASSEIVLAQPK